MHLKLFEHSDKGFFQNHLQHGLITTSIVACILVPSMYVNVTPVIPLTYIDIHDFNAETETLYNLLFLEMIYTLVSSLQNISSPDWSL